METTTTHTTQTQNDFIDHLRQQDTSFLVKANGAMPQFEDHEVHSVFFQADPVCYALLGILPDIQPWQRARIVFQILVEDSIVSACGAEISAEIEVIIGAALCLLSADTALTIFLALRRLRINRKRVSRLLLRFLFRHPAADALWASRRPAVTDCLEHALGRDVLRACVRYAAQEILPSPEATYLRRHALRYGREDVQTKRLLAGLRQGKEVDVSTIALYRGVSEKIGATYAPAVIVPPIVTAGDRGVVTQTLTALYRQTPQSDLSRRFAEGLAALAERSPRFPAGFHVALVLDTSASLQGYGDREFCIAASAITLWRVLYRACTEPVAVFGVNDEAALSGALPLPDGTTDLASGLIDALETRPDLILIVSDGYENHCAGDLARVIATLPQIGVATPILFVAPLFTSRDDRALRRPVPKLPELTFWHENELPGLLRMAWLYTPEGAAGLTDWIRTVMLPRLKEITTWIN